MQEEVCVEQIQRGFKRRGSRVAQDVNRNAETVCLRREKKRAIGKADERRQWKVLLYPSVFFSELVERDRGFMIILILDPEFPRLAATANPVRARLRSRAWLDQTALLLFAALTGDPAVSGLRDGRHRVSVSLSFSWTSHPLCSPSSLSSWLAAGFVARTLVVMTCSGAGNSLRDWMEGETLHLDLKSSSGSSNVCWYC